MISNDSFIEKYNVNETDLYCSDCKGWTRQTYKGVLADKSKLYRCKQCGCENCVSSEE
jgi:transposase-like protein